MDEEEQKKYFIYPLVTELDIEGIPAFNFGEILATEHEWHFFKDYKDVVDKTTIYYDFGCSGDECSESYKGEIGIDVTTNPPITTDAVMFYHVTAGDTFTDDEILQAYDALTQYFIEPPIEPAGIPTEIIIVAGLTIVAGIVYFLTRK